MNLFKRTLIGTAIAASFGTSGCSGLLTKVQADGQYPVLKGPPVTINETPTTHALYCLNEQLSERRVRISVGDIKDLTGKFSELDGGYRIPQSATLMAITALSKLHPIRIVERTDLTVFDFELGMGGKGVLGDGKGAWKDSNGKRVNYRATQIGQVVGSDYFITGGVTKLDYDIFSGGAELVVNGIGGGMRKYVLNIAADLRLVDTRTLEVVKIVPVQKQVVGFETKAGIFKFFDSHLVDLSMGEKSQEPLSLGVRQLMEVGVTILMGHVYNVDSATVDNCITGSSERFENRNDPVVAATAPVKEVCNFKAPFTANSGDYYSLVGSFKKESSAHRHVKDLVGQSPNVFSDRTYMVVPTNTCNGPWYGVYFGPFDKKDTAHDFCAASHFGKNECLIKRLPTSEYTLHRTEAVEVVESEVLDLPPIEEPKPKVNVIQLPRAKETKTIFIQHLFLNP